jgi:hypothetical protein
MEDRCKDLFMMEAAMAREDEARTALENAGLNLDSETLDRLIAGEEVELSPTADDCCPDGWIGIGHKPRWCFKIGLDPRFKICWG